VQSSVTVLPVMTSVDSKLSKTIPNGRPPALLGGFAKRDTFAMSSKARRPLQPLAAEKATERLTFGCRAENTRSPVALWWSRNQTGMSDRLLMSA
jgi:hypothetical protein